MSVTKTCVICGAAFQGRSGTVTCSPGCRAERYRRNNREVMRRARGYDGARRATCPVCGAGFVPGDRRKKYCSLACRFRSRTVAFRRGAASAEDPRPEAPEAGA